MDNELLLIIAGVGLILLALAREVTYPNAGRLLNALGAVAGIVVVVAVLVR